MSTRILVTLEQDADPDEVVQALYEAGAESVTPPQPELPDVAIATFDDTDSEPRIATIQSIEGVRVAEPDAWRDTSVGPADEGSGTTDVGGYEMGVETEVEHDATEHRTGTDGDAGRRGADTDG